jgi:putative copper export protein
LIPDSALQAGGPEVHAATAVLLRALHHAGNLGAAGLAFFASLFGARLDAADAARLRRWTAGASALGLAAAPAILAAQVWVLTDRDTVRHAEVWGLVLRLRAGASYGPGAAGLLLVATAAGRSRARPVAAAGGVLAVCASYALLGHAAAGGPRRLLAGLLPVHLVAVAFWIGSLPPLAWAARQREGPAAARLVRDWTC